MGDARGAATTARPGAVPDAGPPRGAIHALGFHAAYACRRSGNCCRSGNWVIWVEPGLAEKLAKALADGTLVPPDPSLSPAEILTERPGGRRWRYLGAGADGYCHLLDQAAGNRCAVHAQLGPEALPTVCRYFPRMALRRPGGDYVSFSCACPTAAAMLFEEGGAFAVVTNPPGLAQDHYGSVDVRRRPPPRLTPEARMPAGMNEEWERHAVVALARDDQTPETALALLAGSVEQARGRLAGKGGTDPVGAAIAAAGDRSDALAGVLVGLGPGLGEAGRHFRALLGLSATQQPEVDRLTRRFTTRYGGPDRAGADARLAGDWERRVAPAWPGFALPLRRYLAARMFANPCVYNADGLRSGLFRAVCHLLAVRIAATLACAEADQPLDADTLKQAIIHTDLLLVHPGGIPKYIEYWDRAEYLSLADILRPLAP